MAFRLEDIFCFINFHKKIKNQHTGTPQKFADSFNISRSWMYENLNDLKNNGAEIGYSRVKQTFFYKNNFDISITVKIDNKQILNKSELKKTKGGKNTLLRKTFPYFIVDGNVLCLLR